MRRVAMTERLQAAMAAMRAWYASHSPRDQRIILGVVVLVLLSLLYLGVVVPVRDFRDAVASEIAKGQEELEREARRLGAIESLRAERAALEKKLQQARSRLLPGRTGTLGAAALQERTNGLAAEKGVTIQSTQVMKEEAVDPYRRVAVRLTLSGELRPFADMVSALEYGQQLSIPFVEITRRGAVAGAKGPRTLSATMEVNGFVLAEEPKAEPPKPDETAGEGDGGEAQPAGDAAAPPPQAVPGEPAAAPGGPDLAEPPAPDAPRGASADQPAAGPPPPGAAGGAPPATGTTAPVKPKPDGRS